MGFWRYAGVGALGQSTLPQPCYAHTRLCKSRLSSLAVVQQIGRVGAPSVPLTLAVP